MNHNKTKIELRKELKEKRKKISPAHRKMTSLNLLKHFQNISGNVLSFASFGDEIDLWLLNWCFMEKRKLILPKIEGNSLKLYQVFNFSEHLSLSKWGFYEPIADHCEQISPKKIDYAFIPGLGFDHTYHRIGYGKGHYDRLIPKMSNAQTIGLGYTTQLLKEKIPFELHDCPVDELLLL